MSKHALSAEAKASMKQNLELELATRKEKLSAMCEAQIASLKSRLERRVNRVPNATRNVNILNMLDSFTTSKKEVAPAAKRGRPAAPAKTSAPTKAPAPKTRELPPPAPKAPTRGVKRQSNEMSSDKENITEQQLAVPKKRVKAAPTARSAATTSNSIATAPARTTRAGATARTTRAASRTKAAAPEVLSPKSNNQRPTAAQTRTRRQR